jgi:MFS transporter, DHA1 family, tetracycline resistance protein
MTPLAIIVFIVLIDLLGFSIVMPLLAPFAEHYGFADWQIGLLFAAYPCCQLFAGPILGRLSDRFGRRPLLAFSQAGTALSFILLGCSRDFRVMLLARMLDGASGGNILVAQAYVADVTTPENRARGMGLIGMAFGLGFVLGPLIGGLLLSLPVPPEWSLRIPFLVAAGFSTVAWVLVMTRLPESLPAQLSLRKSARVASWRDIVQTLALPKVGKLILVGFLAVLAFATFEATFALFLSRRLGWTSQSAAFAFAGLGLVTALVQGGLIRRIVPLYGEVRLIRVGVILAASGLLGLCVTYNRLELFASLLLLGLGQGILSPCVSGLLSRSTPESEQGTVLGTLSSLQTVARMISYTCSNLLLGLGWTAAPYAAACGSDALALVVASTLSAVPRAKTAGALPIKEADRPTASARSASN